MEQVGGAGSDELRAGAGGAVGRGRGYAVDRERERRLDFVAVGAAEPCCARQDGVLTRGRVLGHLCERNHHRRRRVGGQCGCAIEEGVHVDARVAGRALLGGGHRDDHRVHSCCQVVGEPLLVAVAGSGGVHVEHSVGRGERATVGDEDRVRCARIDELLCGGQQVGSGGRPVDGDLGDARRGHLHVVDPDPGRGVRRRPRRLRPRRGGPLVRTSVGACVGDGLPARARIGDRAVGVVHVEGRDSDIDRR